MSVIVFGATGAIGRAMVTALERDHHDVLPVCCSAETRVNISDSESIRAMYRAVGQVDARICAAAEARFGPLQQLNDEDFSIIPDQQAGSFRSLSRTDWDRRIPAQRGKPPDRPREPLRHGRLAP